MESLDRRNPPRLVGIVARKADAQCINATIRMIPRNLDMIARDNPRMTQSFGRLEMEMDGDD